MKYLDVLMDLTKVVSHYLQIAMPLLLVVMTLLPKPGKPFGAHLAHEDAKHHKRCRGSCRTPGQEQHPAPQNNLAQARLHSAVQYLKVHSSLSEGLDHCM